MAKRQILQVLSRLDVSRKWLLASAGMVALSTLMPWYEDLDAFGAGDLYLGVTGPLFLVGLMILGTSLFMAGWILLPHFGKRLPSIPVKEGALFTFLGLQDLLLLLVANSVFFHPKFGVNITLKDTRFGMIFAFAGVLSVIWSGYRLYKRESLPGYVRDSARMEPLIRVPEMDRTARSVREEDESNTPLRNGQGLVDRAIDNINKEQGRQSSSLPRRVPSDQRPADEGRSAPQPLRMDL